eukprot:TRINITY_DN37208_c0_g2_i1.p1 TRINITY_DN37208_c0_g2~~TRINITY_DN37208_c0_g2_i1.p1  ORF type:complete len:258 (+),score=9.19 TRINITY_DN37208_c0_g2_i1:77-850(+)
MCIRDSINAEYMGYSYILLLNQLTRKFHLNRLFIQQTNQISQSNQYQVNQLKNRYKLFITHRLNSELLRNTSVLISGTVIAQLIPIFLQPFLRRYFTPESFGAFSVYSSIVGILIIISSFKYEQAIVLPKKDKESLNLVALSLVINFFFCLALLVIVLLFKKRLLNLLNISEKFSTILYLIPLGTFLINTFQSFNYWLIRKKAFISISLNKFIRRGFEGFAQVILAFLKNVKGLVFGDIIGQLSNIVTVIILSLIHI